MKSGLSHAACHSGFDMSAKSRVPNETEYDRSARGTTCQICEKDIHRNDVLNDAARESFHVLFFTIFSRSCVNVFCEQRLVIALE